METLNTLQMRMSNYRDTTLDCGEVFIRARTMWLDGRMPLALKSVSMIFDNQCRVENDPYRAERLAWDGT